MKLAGAICAVVVGVGCSGVSEKSPLSPSGTTAVNLDHTGPGAHKHFTVTMTPASVSANTSAVLHVRIDNCGAATPGCTDGSSSTNGAGQQLGTAQIVVPSALTVTAVGNFSGTDSWIRRVGQTGNTVDVGGNGSNKLAPGEFVTFDITVTASVCGTYPFANPQGANSDIGSAFDPSWDFYGGLTIDVVNCSLTCDAPAAPAVANHYLRDIGVPNNSDPFKNIIAQVAIHMGPGATFDGSSPCDPDYAAKVIAFVNTILNGLGISHP